MNKYFILTLFACLCLVTSTSVAQFKTIPQGTTITPEQKQNSKIFSSMVDYSPANSITPNAITTAPAQWKSMDLKGTSHTSRINKFGGVKYVKSTGINGDRAVFASVIGQFAEEVNAKDISQQANLIETWDDEIGHTHHRFNQSANGIRIYGSESILHFDDKGGSYLQSDLVPDNFPIPAIENQLSDEEVKAIVVESLDHYTEVDPKNAILIGGDQWKIEEIYYLHEGDLVHTYFVQVYTSLADRIELFVQANDGDILHQHSSICRFHNHDHEGHDHDGDNHHADNKSVLVDGADTSSGSDLFGIFRTVNTYEVGTRHYLIDASRPFFNAPASSMPNEPVGVLWTIDAFNTAPQNNNFNFDHVSVTGNNFSNKETEISAHYNAGLSYEYFNSKFNRNAIDNNGGNIVSIVNVANEDGSSMGNAFWNGAAMFYGNGDNSFLPLGRGLDVAGHELSHGVIQNTANLEYQGQSGALNESFADVFGAMIDRDDWLIGEDVVRPSAFPSGALRSMSDPHNGASTGDFNSGWQPRHFNERFTGSADNGGVHINSGIPNFAYFLFASDVGREMAENVYYRALTTYLTRSSQFADCRAAVVQAASDIGNASVVAAANSAFDQVGILGSGGTSTQNEAEVNLGDEFIVYGATDLSALRLADGDGNNIIDNGGNFVDMGLISRPSVTDDGTIIMFISDDNRMQRIDIDWQQGSFGIEVFDDQPIWRNVIVSKDGLRLAALTDELEPRILVFEFATGETQAFTLFNPTFTEGVSTGDVLYADAMEFDITGQRILYDAFNEITGTTGEINYWDIGIIDVYDRSTQSFDDGRIEKLFTALPEDVSIGNATFSKNTPFIIAFDVLEGSEFALAGYNIETSDLNIIRELVDIGFPNYSTDDTRIVFDDPFTFGLDLGTTVLNSDKISSDPNSYRVFIESAKWGIFFSNGIRQLYVSTDETNIEEFAVLPNPASEQVVVSGDALIDANYVEVVDQLGRVVYSSQVNARDHHTLDVSDYRSGMYTIRMLDDGQLLGISRLVVR